MKESHGCQDTSIARPAATPALAGLLTVAQRLARSPSRCFFIGGEVGVGKRMLASFIHSESTRAARPYVVVDLTAMAPEHMDLALFGTQGLLVSADGGTVLLQELTALPNLLQRKLLEVVQARTFEAADSGGACTVDVRIIVGSNYDLEGADRAMVREDLRYRITAVQLYVPPLRHRRDDVLALATHFLLNADGVHDRELRFAPEAMAALQAYPWPHNVRELRQVVETAVTALAAERKVVLVSDLNLPELTTVSPPRSTRPPPPAFTFAVGSMPSMALSPAELHVTSAGSAASVTSAGSTGSAGSTAMSAAAQQRLSSELGESSNAPIPVAAAPWQAPQYRAPTLLGVSAERLWDELQRNGVLE